MGKILVTGANGNIGSYVVDELVRRGKFVKAGVYSVQKAMFHDPQVEIVPFNFMDEKTFDEALRDVDRVFLVRPPQLANPKRDMKPFLTATKVHGVSQIVFVSLMGVEKNPLVPHRKIEKMIKELNIPYTFLRASFFMQNLNTAHLNDIKLRDELYMPVGKAKTSFIDTRDIATAAAICLCEDSHIGKAYTLTCSEALDYYEVERILSVELGRKIEYKNPGTFEFRRTLIARGTEPTFANVMMMLYVATKLGTASKITSDTEELIGRKPITMKQYAEDYRELWI